MEQWTTKATNMVGKTCQVGRISLLSIQKEKVVFFLLLSSVLTGWSRFWTLTADTASFGEGTAVLFVPGPLLRIHPQLRQISEGAPCTPLPFPSQLNQRSKCITLAEENSTTGWSGKREVRRETEDLIQNTKENFCKGHQGPPYHCGAE